MSKQLVRHGVNLNAASSTRLQRTTNLDTVLCVDIETTTDFKPSKNVQSTRVGFYVVKIISSNTIIDSGIFYDPTNLSGDEKHTLASYITTFNQIFNNHVNGHYKNHMRDNPNREYSYPFKSALEYYQHSNVRLMTEQQFIKQRLYPCMLRGVNVVNHNIAFDLGAMAHQYTAYNDSGFIMSLCDCEKTSVKVPFNTGTGDTNMMYVCDNHPNVITRRLGAKSHMYLDSDAGDVGNIIDTITIGRALLGPGDGSLKGMGKRFKCAIQKSTADDGHGTQLTHDYLTYMINDVFATIDLFEHQISVYKQHGLDTPLTHILSEASIGKAYYNALDVVPFLKQHPNIPRYIYNIAMQTYYGARSEVKMRLSPVEIRYCDFKSQYPTVNALLGLQDLLLAETISIHHCVDKAQKIINMITLEHLQNKKMWRNLRILVKIKPDGDVLPVRFMEKIPGKGNKKIYAVCHVHNDDGWYDLCDVIASKLLNNDTPVQIIDAIELIPHGRIQTNIIKLFSDERYIIDLNRDDFFTRVIDLRTEVKGKMDILSPDDDEYAYLDSLQLALKLIANATSYGVLVETLLQHGDEYAGKYYASPIATHITSAARLLLAIAERLGKDRRINYAACDTDSMMYCKPDLMDSTTFRNHVDDIVNWFTPLSPYAKNSNGVAPALFELEGMNFIDKEAKKTLITNGIDPTTVDDTLFFLGVSCKRYALYNKLPNGQLLLRKISAHATGRYQFDFDLPLPNNMIAPSDTTMLLDDSDTPDDDIEDNDETIIAPMGKFKRYQYIMWYRAIQLAEQGIIPYIPVEDWSNNIVRYQETITTPSKLKQRSYIPGLRPYSFLTETPVSEIPNTSTRSKKPTMKRKYRYFMSFAYYEKDILSHAVYRTGDGTIDKQPDFEPLHVRFKDFFTNTEYKAANGNDKGLLQRRIVWLTGVQSRTRNGKVASDDQETIQ